jgi:hypothetical protein
MGYTATTLSSQCCYNVVTLLLPCCYPGVTLFLHCCYIIVMLLLHFCSSVVATAAVALCNTVVVPLLVSDTITVTLSHNYRYSRTQLQLP